MAKERKEARVVLDRIIDRSNILGFTPGQWYPVVGATYGGELKILDNHRVVRYMLADFWEVRTVKR